MSKYSTRSITNPVVVKRLVRACDVKLGLRGASRRVKGMPLVAVNYAMDTEDAHLLAITEPSLSFSQELEVPQDDSLYMIKMFRPLGSDWGCILRKRVDIEYFEIAVCGKCLQEEHAYCRDGYLLSDYPLAGWRSVGDIVSPIPCRMCGSNRAKTNRTA